MGRMVAMYAIIEASTRLTILVNYKGTTEGGIRMITRLTIGLAIFDGGDARDPINLQVEVKQGSFGRFADVDL